MKQVNDHIGEPVDAAVGHAPRIVKVPMHQNADVNPKHHDAKEEEKKKAMSAKVEKADSPRPIGLKGLYPKGATGPAPSTSSDPPKPIGLKGLSPKGATGPAPSASTSKAESERPVGLRGLTPKASAHASPQSGVPAVYSKGDPRHPSSQTAEKKPEPAPKLNWRAETITDNGPVHHVHDTEAEHGMYRVHTVSPKEHHAMYEPKNGYFNDREHLGVHGNVADAVQAVIYHHRDAHEKGTAKKSMSGMTDLFKSELGPHFVADDNDNPHDGGSGQVESSRPGAGVAEHDVIAPLLKSCKGPDAGDDEEFIVSKSEMQTMGLTVEGMDDGWYKITKSEMTRLAPDHLGFLQERKNIVMKGLRPDVSIAKSTPHGYTPRAGGAHGTRGEALVQWSEGSDKEVAAYIEKMGAYGPGTDESVRTRGNGGE